MSGARSGWLVTPIQGILGRRTGLKYRLYFGAGGLAFGLLIGVVQGIKIGHSRGDHVAPSEGPLRAGDAGSASAGSARGGMRSYSGRSNRLRRGAHPAPVTAAPTTQAAARP